MCFQQAQVTAPKPPGVTSSTHPTLGPTNPPGPPKSWQGSPRSKQSPEQPASILSPHSPGPGGQSPPAVGRVEECGQLPREIGVQFDACCASWCQWTRGGWSEVAREGKACLSQARDRHREARQRVQLRARHTETPNPAAAAPAWALSRSGNTRFRSLL